MIRTFLRATAFASMAALLLAISGTMAAAVTVTFSDGGGNGHGQSLEDGAFDIAVAMTSNNDKTPDKVSTWGGISGDQALTVTGFWNYSSQDKRNSKKDPLGYFIGSDYFALSTLKNPPAIQDGTFSFTVAANTAFGWVLASKDGKKGRAAATIFANVETASVPLPAGGLLLMGALGGLAMMRRRKKA